MLVKTSTSQSIIPILFWILYLDFKYYFEVLLQKKPKTKAKTRKQTNIEIFIALAFILVEIIF